MTSSGATGRDCDYVSRYLQEWVDGGAGGRIDLDQAGAHAASCPHCYTRLATFFKTLQLPESRYLRETLDELAWSLLNLARAVVRDRLQAAPEEEQEAAVLAITREGGGSALENAVSGREMIDDAEDYVGSSVVEGLNMESLRGLLLDAEEGAKLRSDLALELFARVTELDSRYEAEAWNWIGALHYRQERLAEAEAAFLKVLSLTEGIREVRSFAHCTLAYIFKHRGDLDRAVRSAQRSVVLAEEDGKDPYFGRFAELYLRLLRGGPDDASEQRNLVAALWSRDWDRFCRDLAAPANRPVREVFANSPLADLHPWGN